jgi:hypothetical protein
MPTVGVAFLCIQYNSFVKYMQHHIFSWQAVVILGFKSLAAIFDTVQECDASGVEDGNICGAYNFF